MLHLGIPSRLGEKLGRRYSQPMSHTYYNFPAPRGLSCKVAQPRLHLSSNHGGCVNPLRRVARRFGSEHTLQGRKRLGLPWFGCQVRRGTAQKWRNPSGIWSSPMVTSALTGCQAEAKSDYEKFHRSKTPFFSDPGGPCARAAALSHGVRVSERHGLCQYGVLFAGKARESALAR